MNKFYLILFLILISNATVFAQSKAAEVFFELGNKRLELKQYDQAIDYFTKCIKVSPTSSACYNNRALAYREKSDLTSAIDDYTEAIKYMPNKADYYNGRATVYHRLKIYALAINDLNSSLKINPANENVKKMLELVTEQAKLSSSLQIMGQVYAKTPDAINAAKKTADDLYNYGSKLIFSDHPTAVKLLSQCLEYKPDHSDCYYSRGLSYAQQSQYEKAIEDFNQAIKLKPANLMNIYVQRGRSYLYTKKYDQALSDFNEWVKIDPKDPQGYGERGNVYVEKKDYQKAEIEYTQALNQAENKEKPTYYFVRGHFYLVHLKNYEAAIADYTEYFKLNPAILWPVVYVERAQAYCALGKKDLALADEKKAIELGKKVEFPCQPKR